MVKLSAAVITLNEEKNIFPLLNNLYPIFDEIVIIDSISKDKTIQRIEDYKETYDKEQEKIKLFLFAQDGPRYSVKWQQPSQRNLALRKTTGDWTLAIDADERLDGDVRPILEKVASRNKIAWALPTYHYWETEDMIRVDGWWYPNYHYRFFKNEANIRYSRHHRHCFPVIRRTREYPDVRGIKVVNERPPCLNEVPIHHYHHVPIKKKCADKYRANTKDVKTLDQLLRGLKVRKIDPRKKGPME